MTIDRSSYNGRMLVKLPNLRRRYCDQKSSEGHVVICKRRINDYCLNPSETAAAAYRQEIKIVRETLKNIFWLINMSPHFYMTALDLLCHKPLKQS